MGPCCDCLCQPICPEHMLSCNILNSVHFVWQKEEPVSAADFLQFPSAQKLRQLGQQRAEELYKTLGVGFLVVYLPVQESETY